MERLIDGLLVFSRVATRGRKPHPTDSAAAFAQALANLQRTVAESGAAVTSEPLPVVAADETQLMELFQNLIDNALKYRAGERPRVHVSACDDEDSWLFCVQDNGIGIAQADHERIFQVFKRLPSAAGVPGTGMGLALCKKIVERHKGRMWVDSAPGKGAAFYFTLPKTAG
jgi:light-regulated signal transduction histidine kinase (bacteriophytochrome)